jgi:hypothetical protein
LLTAVASYEPDQASRKAVGPYRQPLATSLSCSLEPCRMTQRLAGMT